MTDINEQASYECTCGVAVHRPKELGVPKGWLVDSMRNSILCPDCVRSFDFQSHSASAPVQGNAPTPIAGGKPDAKTVSLLRSGVYLDLSDPDYSRVHINDIAAGLARECRFAGQMTGFYPVAQHCVLGSMIAPNHFKYAFLMHDAAEAIIKDIPSPLKALLPDYRKIEAMHEKRLFERFQVPMTKAMKEEVKIIDRIMLAAENHVIRKMPLCAAIPPGELKNSKWTRDFDTAVQLIDGSTQTGWERPFIERFFELAPTCVLQNERKAA